MHARIVKPSDAYGVALLQSGYAWTDRGNNSGNLMTWDEGQVGFNRPIAVSRVEIRVTNAARDYLDKKLARPRRRNRNVFD
jgi:hypothetical protein